MSFGAVTNSSNYYSKQYGVAEEAPLPQTEELDEMQAELEAEAAWSEKTPDGDFFVDGDDATEQRFSTAGLVEELQVQEQELAAKIAAQPENDEARQVHQSLQNFIKRLLPLGEDAAVPQYLMDEYLLLEGELGKVQLQLEIHAQVSEPLARIESLTENLEAALDGVDLEDSVREEMETLLRKLGKAKSSLELAANPEAAAEAEASVEELLGQAEELVGGYEEGHETQRSEIEQAIENFQVGLETAGASKKDQLKAAKKIAELKSQLEDGSIPLKDIAQGLKDAEALLQEGVKEQADRQNAKAAYQSLAGKIAMTLFNSSETQELATRISKAVESGHWSSVKGYLSEIAKYNDYVGNDLMISQLIGALYYGPAGESDKELKKILDIMPKDIREQMIDMTALNTSGDRGWGLGTTADWRKAGLYGSTSATVAILRDSLN